MEDETLKALLDAWRERAEDARPRGRIEHAGDIQSASYYRGVYETCRAVIADLEALLQCEPAAAPDEPPLFEPVTLPQVRALLEASGLYPRALHAHNDGAFTAIFSRLQPMTQDERRARLTAGDPRLIILADGALLDSGEPYVEFAFRA